MYNDLIPNKELKNYCSGIRLGIWYLNEHISVEISNDQYFVTVASILNFPSFDLSRF